MATVPPVPAPTRSYEFHGSGAFWVQAAVVLALLVSLYATVLADLANDWWTDPTLSQGLLIPPLAFYIAWLQRHSTFSHPAAADCRGFPVTVGACLLLLLGKLAAEYFLCRISFVILLAGLVWIFWGLPRLRTLTFPFLLLATMVPLPAIVDSALAAPLQLFASDAATNVSQLLGVSVYRDGNIIHLAHISLGVERACSGLSSLSALVVGSILLGFLQCSQPVPRILLFAASIPISIGVNALRVAGTAVLADHDEAFAMGFYHSFSGWLVFLLGFGSLYLCCMLLCALFERKRAT
jgi:exosortase